MTPGTYIRLRRERMGLTLRELAFQFAIPPALAQHAAEQRLGDAENDVAPLGAAELGRLYLFLSFDREIYEALVAGLPTRSVCGGCGCSWWDPCLDATRAPCAWADEAATICTHCRRAQAA